MIDNKQCIRQQVVEQYGFPKSTLFREYRNQKITEKRNIVYALIHAANCDMLFTELNARYFMQNYLNSKGGKNKIFKPIHKRHWPESF